MTRRSSAGIALVLAAILAGGCDRTSAPDKQPTSFAPIAASVIAIAKDTAQVKTGPVGAGDAAHTATYVLVDAKNTADSDVIATLKGTLEGGVTLGNQSIRIPAGGERTFALIAARPSPGAAIADLTVAAAVVPAYPLRIVVKDGHVFADGDRVIAQAGIHNTTQRKAQVVIVAGFYDAAGHIMKRPFTAVAIDGGETFPVQFVGPQGSRRAYIFVGQVIY